VVLPDQKEKGKMTKKFEKFARCVAIHEAAHAVVAAVVIGSEFIDHIELWKEGRRTKGHVVPVVTEYDIGALEAVGAAGIIPLAAVAAAGIIAQNRVYKRSETDVFFTYGIGDDNLIDEYSKLLGYDCHDEAEELAKTVIKQNWRTIEVVADELMQTGYVTCERFEELYDIQTMAAA
jgi:hypothetical protein